MKKKDHSSPMRFVSSGENKTNLKDAHTQKQATQHCLKITPKHMTEKKTYSRSKPDTRISHKQMKERQISLIFNPRPGMLPHLHTRLPHQQLRPGIAGTLRPNHSCCSQPL